MNIFKKAKLQCYFTIFAIILFHTSYGQQSIELPDWFFEPPAGSVNSFYVIGISDPQMEQQDGLDLAFLRAKTIASIQANTKVKIVLEDYYKAVTQGSKEDINHEYDNVSQIISAINLEQYSISISKKAITANNETIVLVQVKKTPEAIHSSDSLGFLCSKTIRDRNTNGQRSLFYNNSLIIKAKNNENRTYFSKILDNGKVADSNKIKYSSISVMQINTFTFEQFSENVNYLTGGNLTPAISYGLENKDRIVADQSNYLTHGLWYSYITNITDAIEFIAASLDLSKIEEVQEFYERNDENSFQSMSKYVIDKNISTFLLNQGIYKDEYGDLLLKTNIELIKVYQ